jgi:xylan 1,4-beta-xylosidase
MNIRGWIFNRNRWSLALCFLIGILAWAHATNYTITANAAAKKGTWSRFYEEAVATCHVYTVINSAYGRNLKGALKRGNTEAGFKHFRGHDVFGSDVAIYNEVNGVITPNWKNFDSIYDGAKAAGMYPILELSYLPWQLASAGGSFGWYNGHPGSTALPKDYNKYREIIKLLVQHAEQRYGVDVVRQNWLFEVYNEPDLFYDGTQADYFKLYDYASDGVKLADSLCKVGGPAASGGSDRPNWIGGFIDHVLKGTNAATQKVGSKCDFISYHRYSDDIDYSGRICTPASQNNYHKAIVDVLKNKGFSGFLINTEWGPTYSSSSIRDNETDASFVAKTIHLLSDNGANYPPPLMYAYWTISDIYEEFNAYDKKGVCYSFDDGNYGMLIRGAPSVSASWDLPKPVFNAFKLLHQLGDIRIDLTGGTTSDGVNGCATISADSNAVQVLLYNHYNGGGANIATSDNVTLTVNNIPFAPGTVGVQQLVVDGTRSNAYRAWKTMGSPAQPSATQWTTLIAAAELANQDPPTTVTLTGKTFTKTFPLYYYGVTLIKLTNGSNVSARVPHHAPAFQTGPGIIVRGRTIYAQGNAGVAEIRLINAAGKTVARVASGPLSLDNGIPSGAYMLECSDQARSIVLPIIVGK